MESVDHNLNRIVTALLTQAPYDFFTKQWSKYDETQHSESSQTTHKSCSYARYRSDNGVICLQIFSDLIRRLFSVVNV